MKTAKGIFVTGTDTEVGKTVVTRAVLRALRRRGLKVAAAKPVESGAIDGPLDAIALVAASMEDVPVDRISVYTFADPVSPHLAASREGVAIVPTPIFELLEERARGADLVIAEGAGGLMVPLSQSLIYADVIARTGYKLVIVAPDVLGAINATLLTIEAARARQIEVLGVILNRGPEAHLGNAEAIERHGDVPILGCFPVAEGADDDTLAALAEQNIDLERVISALAL